MWLFVATILMGYLYFFGLGLPLVGPDEPRYSQVAREMFERGDWVTTTLGGFNWFEKPALLYWLQISAYNIFGVSEFSARIGSALFGLGTVFCLFFIGLKESVGFEARSGRTPFAFWMLAIPATCLGLIAFSRGASFDIIVTFPLTASLTFFYLWYLEAERSGKTSTRYLFLAGFYFFAGVATLAKGLIGIVFPAATVSFFYILKWQLPRKDLLISIAWGPVLGLLAASSWYLPMYLRHGWEFIDQFFVQHHFQRYTSNKYRHPQPFWFFWLIFPLMTIPWIPFFLVSVWKEGKRIGIDLYSRFSGRSKSEAPSDLVFFAFAWMLVPLVFFSFSGSKLPGYVLPSLPPAAILTAIFVNKFAAVSKARDMISKSFAIGMFTVCIIILALIAPSFFYADSAKGLIEAAEKKGARNLKVAAFKATNHGLEFYAAGRLIREPEGTQRVHRSPSEIVDLASTQPTGSVLVVRLNWEKWKEDQLPGFDSESLAVFGEWEIVVVRPSERKLKE